MTMRAISTLLVAAAIVLPAAGHTAPRKAPEAQLQEEIAGKVAGAPVDCIDVSRIRSSRVISGTAIVYQVGRTTYVNVPASGARSLRPWDTLVRHVRADADRFGVPRQVRPLQQSGQRHPLIAGFPSGDFFTKLRSLPCFWTFPKAGLTAGGWRDQAVGLPSVRTGTSASRLRRAAARRAGRCTRPKHCGGN
jgi:hypothetical protein